MLLEKLDMIGYYAGMALIAVVSVLCLREALTQWRKAEALSEQTDKQLQGREAECQSYALGWLVISGAFALLDIIAGGIVWACTG